LFLFPIVKCLFPIFAAAHLPGASLSECLVQENELLRFLYAVMHTLLSPDEVVACAVRTSRLLGVPEFSALVPCADQIFPSFSWIVCFL